MEVCNSDEAIKALGSLWRKPIGRFDSGQMRAYKIDGGGFRLGDGSRGQRIMPVPQRFVGKHADASEVNEDEAVDGKVLVGSGRPEDNKLVWRFPRVQMTFREC